MIVYVSRRLLLMIPTLFVVSLIVFFMMRLIPGDIVDAILAQQMAGHAGGAGGTAEEARENILQDLGMDVPVVIQYGRWVGVLPGADGSFSGLFQGDLGDSLVRSTTVFEEISHRWPITFQLGFMALILAQLIALPIGVYSALRQDTWGDYIARSFAVMCIAVPAFWVGTMAIVLPSIWWAYMPSISLIPFTEDPIGNLKMFIIPAVVLGMAMSGGTMRMTRTMMLEVLRKDYIRTAWAKGLKERVVILRHALKNALIPVITIIGLQMPIMIGGTVIIEQIFVLPGMGSLIIDAFKLRDYTMVSGIMLVLAVFIMLTTLVVDITYAYLDPRVSYN